MKTLLLSLLTTLTLAGVTIASGRSSWVVKPQAKSKISL
jgi:hypothetical protein